MNVKFALFYFVMHRARKLDNRQRTGLVADNTDCVCVCVCAL